MTEHKTSNQKRCNSGHMPGGFILMILVAGLIIAAYFLFPTPEYNPPLPGPIQEMSTGNHNQI